MHSVARVAVFSEHVKLASTVHVSEHPSHDSFPFPSSQASSEVIPGQLLAANYQTPSPHPVAAPKTALI